MDLDRIANILHVSRDSLERLPSRFMKVLLVMALAYVFASGFSAFLVSGLMSKAMASLNRANRRQGEANITSFSSPSSNYHDLQKTIKDRNLFNRSGEFPDESMAAVKAGKDRKASSFDINAACSKSSVNVELVGTIYLNGGASIATLQEQGYGESDIYREGDLIIGNEGAQIAKIDRNRVILNNNGVKECLELIIVSKKILEGEGTTASGALAGGAGANRSGEAPTNVENTCLLDEKYVQDELGPGFGTIIQKARLVPNTADGQMNGFKIFAIDQASLLGKTGLQNGDIITQVNETSLKQPEQGFALYQAFQDEREVRIHILRRGTTPMMITCRIK